MSPPTPSVALSANLPVEGWQLFSNLSYFTTVLHFPSMLQGPGRCLLCLSDVMPFCYKNFSVLVQEVHWTACCWDCCYGSICFLNCSHSVSYFFHIVSCIRLLSQIPKYFLLFLQIDYRVELFSLKNIYFYFEFELYIRLIFCIIFNHFCFIEGYISFRNKAIQKTIKDMTD